MIATIEFVRIWRMVVSFRRVGKPIGICVGGALLKVGGESGSFDVQLAIGVGREWCYRVSGTSDGGCVVGMDVLLVRGVQRRRVILAVGGIWRLQGRHLGSSTLGHR